MMALTEEQIARTWEAVAKMKTLRQQALVTCREVEALMLERFPDELASIPLDPGYSRLIFNDEGISVETFALPALARHKKTPVFEVVDMSEVDVDVLDRVLFQILELAHVVFSRHGQGHLLAPYMERMRAQQA